MRRRREEFDADALPFFAQTAEKHDAAFQLILSKRVRQDEHRPGIKLLIQVEQATVGVDNNRVAGFAELPAADVLTFRENANSRENARTAPRTFVDDFRHGKNMVG